MTNGKVAGKSLWLIAEVKENENSRGSLFIKPESATLWQTVQGREPHAYLWSDLIFYAEG